MNNLPQLRPHQVKAEINVRNSFMKGNKRVQFMAATGWGKSVFAAHLIKKALKKGKRVCFVVDRITLIEQMAKDLDEWGFDFGIIQSKNERWDMGKPFQLASVQTWVRLREKPTIDFFIQDESHSLYKKFTEYMTQTINNVPLLSISATPWTPGMLEIYDDLVLSETTQELIDMGFLCDYVVYGTDDIDLSNVKITRGDYDEKEILKKVNTGKVIGNVIETWLRRGENRRTVAFVHNIAHGVAVRDEFISNGVTAECVTAYTDPEDRKAIFDRHDSSETKILINCTLLSKGWNSVSTTCMILCRSTKSETLFTQCVGRVLRVSPCGKDAIILDHSQTFATLGFPTDIIKTELVSGEKKDKSAQKKEELEREEKAPKPCPNCGFMHNVFRCEKCGHEPKLNPRVQMIKAELKKLERKAKTPAEQRNKDWSNENKQLFFGSLLQHAHFKKYKKGWAAMNYKEYFSVYPNSRDEIKNEITPEARSYIQSKNIAWANAK